MSHDDFEFEPRPGLPALLPEGEQLLWQGSPRWRSLAVRAYQVRKVAVYFGILVLWRAAVGVGNAHSFAAVALSCLFILFLGSVAFGVLCLLAYLNARSTIYSITSRRVLLRHGVAVQLTMNIPLKFVQTAALRPFADGTGDIALTLLPSSERIGFVISWPHLRPGRFTRPQPSLRALADAKEAAAILSAALAAEGADAAIEGTTIRIQPAESGQPSESGGAGTRIPGRAVAAA
jgi:hypothetical protein